MKRLFDMQFIAVAMLCMFGLHSVASAQTLRFTTVERPPFSIGTEDQTGFSIDLMRALAEILGREVEFETVDSFPVMLDAVANGSVDGAIANISITAAREEVLDFTQPIFASGLQIMVAGDQRPSLWRQIFTAEILTSLVVAVGVLFVLGMLMWVFERRRQPYFERPAHQALFPSFWWALNLVVNGGFEERMPRSIMGRITAVIMVFSSLFVVSIFVAQITSAMTVTVLTSTVTGLNDLDMHQVATVEGSTASDFLDNRDVRHATYPSFQDMITGFETGNANVLVFDGPLLRYYLAQLNSSRVYLVDQVFRHEDYGIALPTGSPLREPLNQAILTMREDGSYQELVRKWFGNP